MCRRRNHQPLVVTAGILAYNQYKKYQQKKRDHVLAIDRAMADASLPIPASSGPIDGIPVDAPPAYDSIGSPMDMKDTFDSPIDKKDSFDPDAKVPYATPYPADPTSAIQIPPNTDAPPAIAASYRVHIKTCHGALHSARLTPPDSCCTAYSVRWHAPSASLRVHRGCGCAPIATAHLPAESSAAAGSAAITTAELSLGALGRGRLAWDVGARAWAVVLPQADGETAMFWWREVRSGVGMAGQGVGGWIWRLEDGEGRVVAVWMDDVGRKSGGRGREGVLNVVRAGLSERMRDAVVASCFVVVKQREGMVGKV
ncbi:MAG: hypothetical protein M1821_010009 [Bathelium mastoideum]|nr:MAG: hypothetical protein M1821_010009 [Bathelium mastoideum]